MNDDFPEGVGELYKELYYLFKDNPDAFEQRRKDLIEEMLAKCPEDQKEENIRLQGEIENVISRSKTQLGRLQHFQDFFMTRVYGEDGSIEQITERCLEVKEVLEGKNPAVPKAKKVNLKIVK